MKRRAQIPDRVQAEVLLASRRRCCLCLYLYDDDTVHRGQIAHLNQNPSDCRFNNLVWLCFNHHDEYDSRTSQAKGLMEHEVRTYRDKLYQVGGDNSAETSSAPLPKEVIESDDDDIVQSQYAEIRCKNSDQLGYLTEPWRFPLWQVGNRPELFAYKAANRCDGICLIERVNIPDGRIVVIAIQITGNPGNSITNCVEELCHQVCERFSIPADRLVWIEHYDSGSNFRPPEWDMVTFETMPPLGLFAGPKWTPMSRSAWQELRLRPKKRLKEDPFGFEYESKVEKFFDWPSEAL